MKRSVVIFALVLSVLLALVFAYTGLRLTDNVTLRALLALPFVLIWLVPVVHWGGRRESRTLADHLVQYLAFLSMGWVSFLLVSTVMVDLARLVLYVGSRSDLSEFFGYGDYAAPGLAAAGFVAGLVTSRFGLVVRSVTVEIDGLHPDLAGLRIVQVSDLHVGPTIKRPYVERVVALCNTLRPDVVALTGDFVDGSVAVLEDDVAPLAALEPKGRVYFVTGNHEYYSGAPQWVRHLQTLGIEVLHNSHAVLRHGGASVLVGGVPDGAIRMLDNGAPGPDPKLAAGDAAADFRLLLAHHPKLARAGAEAGFDLQLSGHTHAGQFFPWTIVARLVHAPHFAGLSREGRMRVYVSAGTGAWGPPLRLGTRAEVTLIQLAPSTGASKRSDRG